MKKILGSVLNSLVDIQSPRMTQVFNFIICLILATVLKIFLILQIHGEVFGTSFEICVWVFMVIWLTLRLLHSFNLLEGYYAVATVPVFIGIIFPTETITMVISIVLFALGYLYEIILMLKNIQRNDAVHAEGEQK